VTLDAGLRKVKTPFSPTIVLAENEQPVLQKNNSSNLQ
jgi:hypothetical protein